MNPLVTIDDCQIIMLPKIGNRSGNITPIDGKRIIPFNVRRVFYIYDIPAGASRGAHAHKSCHQLIVAASGSFEVELSDGHNKRTVFLNQPDNGLHIPPYIWAAEKGFSSGAICLVLASEIYLEEEYIRNYQDFLQIKNNHNAQA